MAPNVDLSSVQWEIAITVEVAKDNFFYRDGLCELDQNQFYPTLSYGDNDATRSWS